MAERLLRTAPPRVAKFPTRKAFFLVGAGILSVFCAIGFAAQALTKHKSRDGANPGRIAAGLAGGGVFAASLGAPALKRQAQAREALARWAKGRGLSLQGRDEAMGVVDGLLISVRIGYGRGPYAGRGASELIVTVRPGTPDFGWLGDSEPFDEVDVVERHIERLTARAMRRAVPTADA